MNLISRSIRLWDTFDIHELKKEGIFDEGYKFYDWGIEYPPVCNAKIIKNFEFLKTNPKEAKINLYIHIPFCNQLCLFCSIPNIIPDDKILQDYVTALKKEITLSLRNSPWLNKKEVVSLYFGGGTPTVLSKEQLYSLIKHIKSSFNLSDNFEFACETTPDSITSIMGRKKLELLKREGVNRLSIGVQSFNDSVLKKLNRAHNFQAFCTAFKNARKIGFDNINLDMIYGLPYQTLEKWKVSLNILESFSPEGIAPTRLRFTNPFMYKYYIKNQWDFPSEREIIIMRIMSFFKFSKLMYKNVSSIWFEKHKNHSLHYKYRCLGLPYISFGTSARSFVNNHLYYNSSNTQKYMKKISKGLLPIEKSSKLSKIQLMNRKFLHSFYFEKGFNKKAFKKEFGISAGEVFGHFIQKLIRLNLVKTSSKNIRLTLKGKIFKDHIYHQFYMPYNQKIKSRNIKQFLKKLKYYVYSITGNY